MPTTLCCSLCYTPCEEYETLENEDGEYNEIYNITIKYFDPMLITSDEDINKLPQQCQILCQDCWRPIKDFNEFQQNVIRTRTLLEKTEIKLFKTLKIEENHPYDATSNNSKEVDNSKSNDGPDGDYPFDNVDNSKSDDGSNGDYPFENLKSDLEDEHNTDEQFTNIEDDDDDEKPLINLKNKVINKIQTSNQEKQEARTTDEECRKPKRRGRKPKQLKLEEKTKHKSADVEQYPTRNKKIKLSDDDKRDKGNSAMNLGKARQSDAFIAEWKPVLECDLCEETFSNFNNLRSHFNEKHKTRFYIKCCERKFYLKHIFVNHIQLHVNPETHKCDICGKVSTTKKNLKLHKNLMHEEIKQLECEICHRLFTLKHCLDRHLLTHVTGEKNFVCQECGKAYVLEVQLRSHIKTVHNNDRVCDQCGKTVHGVQALKRHLMEHAGIKKIKFPCDECGAELTSRRGLKRHKDAYHHDGSTIYVCSICGKVAASAGALLNHKKFVHTEERKFKCSYCDKAFKRTKELQEHIATHTGQDLYQCPHCPQTFKVSSNMYHHRKKVHPVEYEKARKNRLQVPKVDINHVKNQVVL